VIFVPYSLFHTSTKNDYLTAAKKAIAAITNTKAVKAQRTEAFIEAYSLIPMDDLYKLQHLCNKSKYLRRFGLLLLFLSNIFGGLES
jgi:hypothetical protein